MLPTRWRFVVKNTSTQTQTYNSGARVAVRYTRWKRDSDGALVHAAEASDDFGFGAGDSIANDSWEKMDVAGTGYVDESTDLNEGVDGQLDVTSDHASTNGPFELYVEFSGGATWPTDDVADPDTGDDIETHLVGPIASVELSGAETKSCNFSWSAG